MIVDELLDSYTIKGLEVEMSVVECIYRGIRALKQMEEAHTRRRSYAADMAQNALNESDSEAYNRWMKVFWEEEQAIQMLNKALKELPATDKRG